jgi:hypothetical protein
MEARLPNPNTLLPDVNPAIQQLIKAAPNARVILTGPADMPPTVSMADYVGLEGLWIGGGHRGRDDGGRHLSA